MSLIKRIVLIVVLIGAATVVPRVGGAQLPGKVVTCGQQLRKSVRILNNITCSTDGLIIAAPDITVDLGGHRITGPGPSAGSVNGIAYAAGAKRTTVTNGTIDNFPRALAVPTSRNTIRDVILTGNGVGVLLQDGGRRTSIRRVTIARTAGPGILGFTSGNTVRESTVVDGGSNGIELEGPGGNIVESNEVHTNGPYGIGIFPGAGAEVSSGNRIVGNRVSGGQMGILVSEATETEVALNSTIANSLTGIWAQDSTVAITSNRVVGTFGDGVTINGVAGTIANNTATGNGGSGMLIASAHDLTVQDNTASANDEDGLEFSSSGTNVVARDNDTHENAVHGIQSDSSAVELTDNAAFRNGFLNGVNGTVGSGISAGAGSPGSGNLAGGNDATNQCTPTALCSAAAPPITDPPTTFVQCGDTITTSIRVANNLSGCSADGLTIGADEVSIYGGGHRFTGAGTSVGKGIAGETRSLYGVSDLVVSNFAFGVFVEGSSNGLIEGVVSARNTDGIVMSDGTSNSVRLNDLLGNLRDGIRLHRITGSTHSQNLAAGNGGQGIYLAIDDEENVIDVNDLYANTVGIMVNASPDDNVISENISTGNTEDGIHLDSSVANQVDANTTAANGEDGIFATDGANNNEISANTATGNGFNGIRVISSVGNVVESNVAIGNGLRGLISFSSTTTLRANHANANAISGIGLLGASADVATDNTTNENGGFGIVAISGDPIVSRNVAKWNGFEDGIDDDIGLGIAAGDGATGADNIAKRNDGPAQCDPVSFCA